MWADLKAMSGVVKLGIGAIGALGLGSGAGIKSHLQQQCMSSCIDGLFNDCRADCASAGSGAWVPIVGGALAVLVAVASWLSALDGI